MGVSGVKQYNVQVHGADFVPELPWSSNSTESVRALVANDQRDLLVLDDDEDLMEIVPQATSETVMQRLERTPFDHLLSQMTFANEGPGAAATQASWYLLLDVAALSHADLMSTAAALVGLTVAPDSPGALAAAQQAFCWLWQTKVTAHQLLQPQGIPVLQRLLRQLRKPTAVARFQEPESCGQRSRRLVHDVLALDHQRVNALRLPASWQLIRLAVIERQRLVTTTNYD